MRTPFFLALKFVSDELCSLLSFLPFLNGRMEEDRRNERYGDWEDETEHQELLPFSVDDLTLDFSASSSIPPSLLLLSFL